MNMNYKHRPNLLIASKRQRSLYTSVGLVVLIIACSACSSPVNIIEAYSGLKKERGVSKVYALPPEQTHRITRTVVQWAAYSAPRRFSDSTGIVLYESSFESHYGPAFAASGAFAPGTLQNQVAAWIERVGASDSLRVTFAASGSFVRQNAGEIMHSYFTEAQNIVARGDSLPVQRPWRLQTIE